LRYVTPVFGATAWRVFGLRMEEPASRFER